LAFDDPIVIQSLTTIRTEIDRIGKDALAAQFPDRVRLPATRVTSGEQLGRLAEGSSASHFHWDEDLSGESKAAAAAIFDYLRDYGDEDELYSVTQKLGVYDQLGGLLHDISN